ncbi:hypothetical protein D8674_035333 [Pyrus ussuriensis x Pyrus communis]|uniref:Uncharacterized protein n=1 Tax=Pyrus ussuriensis x Pyrus communis TaxID=2448454 RepID=A0A5N5GCW3_9ROSA|nr:hypothetical protein D8674_035333 [Pyrus ussuriensis x Pyrus communis]
MSVSFNPWALRRFRTESGPSGESKCTFLDAKRAISGDNPHKFMRYDTVKERPFSWSLTFSATNDDLDEYDLRKIASFWKNCKGVTESPKILQLGSANCNILQQELSIINYWLRRNSPNAPRQKCSSCSCS